MGEVCNHRVRIAPSTRPPVGESVAGIIERGQLVIEPKGLTIRCRPMTARADVLLIQTAIDRADAGVTGAI